MARFCGGLLEGCWLVAVVVGPLLFNTRSQEVFEPDKLALLRTLALVMAAAWLILLLESSGRERLSVRLNLMLPAAAFGLVLLISTALSVEPGISWWGTHARQEGAYTMVCYLVIFAAVAFNLRRREQVERLAAAIVTTGFVVGMYGLLQGAGLDPIPWSITSTARVRSSLGNASFAGGYLALTVPLALRGLAQSIITMRKAEATGRRWHLLRVAAYALVSMVELGAIWSTGSRGPILGLGIGLLLALVLLACVVGRRAAPAAIGLGVLAVVLAGAVYLPGGPLRGLAEAGPLGRLGHVLERQDQTSQIRLLIWSGTAKAILPHDPLIYPDGHADPLNGLRLLVGYGPDTVYQVFSHFAPPLLAELGPDEQWDHSHDQILETLLTTGMLGLAAYLALFGAAFVVGARRLIASWRSESGRWRSLLLAALLAGIAGHFVETQVSFPVSATWLYLWAYLALVLSSVHAASADTQPQITESWTPSKLTALVPAAAGMVLMFDFVQGGAVALALLLAASLLVVGVVLSCDDAQSALVFGSATAGAVVLYGGYLIVIANASRLRADDTNGDVLAKSLLASHMYTGLVVALLMAAALAAFGAPGPTGHARGGAGFGALTIAFAAALLISYFTNVRLIRAEYLGSVASLFVEQQDWQTAITLQQRATELAGGDDRLHTDLGGTYVLASGAVRAVTEQMRFLESARSELTMAQRLDPLYPLNTENLAKLWQQWALSQPQAAEAQTRAQMARDLYATALRLAPNAPGFQADRDDFERQWTEARS